MAHAGSHEKCPKSPVWGIFRLFRVSSATFLQPPPPERLFLRIFLLISGPEDPETPVNGRSGRNLSEKNEGATTKAQNSFRNFHIFHTFSHFFRTFPPGLSPSKQRVLAQ